MQLWWFTEEDGQLCLGTGPDSLASIVIATALYPEDPIRRPLTDHEAALVGPIARASAPHVAYIANRSVIR